MKRYLVGIVALVLILALITGCSGAPKSMHPTAKLTMPPGTGMLKVYVTDAPGEIDKILVTIEGLEAHKAGGSWGEPIFTGEETFNLMDLAGIQAFLTSKVVDAGWYTQLRLDLNGYVKIIDVIGEDDEDEVPEDPPDITYNTTVPSGEIKLVGPFEVVEGGITEITLDFDVEKSVHEIGAKNKEYNYIFKPVIKLLVSEPMVLETRGENADAEWTDEIDPGNYSVKLYVSDGTVDMAAVVFEVDIALQDINTLSFQKWVYAFGSSGWNPSIILGIDADNDGEYEVPDDLGWHFTHDPLDLGDQDTFIEGEFPTQLTAADTGWVPVNAITEMRWWGANASDVQTEWFVYPDAGYVALNEIGGFQETSAGDIIDPTDRVRVIKIVIGGSGSWMDETAYVDDFVIAGP